MTKCYMRTDAKPKPKSLLHRLFGWLWKDNPTAPSVKPMTAKDFPKFKE